MAEWNERPPEEIPAPPPGVCPPPEEGAAEAPGHARRARSRRGSARRRSQTGALLLAFAGLALCGAIYAAPVKPATAPQRPADAAVTQPVTPPEPTPGVQTQEPVETPEAPPTDAQRLVAAGIWKNTAADEWVRFCEDGTGWWYDGTYFGRMEWREDDDGAVSYAAAIAYYSPERKYVYDWCPETDGDTPHSAEAEGEIALLAEEDRFTCPGLRFGEGAYLPDDTSIDASVVEAALGKTAAELLSGTAWHMVSASDFGIPCTFGEDDYAQIYTDQVYVQSMDFSSGVFTLTTRDGAVMVVENWVDGEVGVSQGPTRTLSVPFAFSSEDTDRAAACVYAESDTEFWLYTDYLTGDNEYNNRTRLWGADLSGSATLPVYLFFTDDGMRIAVSSCDWYQHNFTVLARD